MKPTIDDCEKFHVKALMKTSRRDPLGDPAEKQYFGTTRDTFAGVSWKFDQDAMILTMGGKEWPIVVLPNVRGTMGTRAFVQGPDGRRYNYLLVLDGKVGTRAELKYRSQDFLKPHQRREWAKTKGDRLPVEPRSLSRHWQDRASYGEASGAAPTGQPMAHHQAGKKLPTIIRKDPKQAEGRRDRRQA